MVKHIKSSKAVTIPIYTGTQRSLLTAEVVECHIPLLLSNTSLKRAHANLDFGSETINFLGEIIPIKISSTGHYCIQLCREPSYNSQSVRRIMFTTPISSDISQSKKNIIKLHRQFAHPHPERLKKLIRDSGTASGEIMELVQQVSEQ